MTPAAAFALDKVGQGYIYGAKGQTCTEAFRQQQAKQYPEQARYMLGVGTKWDGVPVWDCAQLTRYAAKAAGVTLPSGATSPWRKGPWKRKGTISTLPQGQVLFLYRESGGRMQHTGLALGDGTCVHARGTAYGVVRQPVSGYAWTHWASPWNNGERDTVFWAIVTAEHGSTVNLRNKPGGRVIARLPLGTRVKARTQGTKWCAVLYQQKEGYMQSAFLRRQATSEAMQTPACTGRQ